jgi:hypothetical protein
MQVENGDDAMAAYHAVLNTNSIGVEIDADSLILKVTGPGGYDVDHGSRD